MWHSGSRVGQITIFLNLSIYGPISMYVQVKSHEIRMLFQREKDSKNLYGLFLNVFFFCARRDLSNDI